jgi:hypothetical protein
MMRPYLCGSSYNISYQERLREMARRSLDNLLMHTDAESKVPTPSRGISGQISQIPAWKYRNNIFKALLTNQKSFFLPPGDGRGLYSSDGLLVKVSLNKLFLT